MSRAGFVLVGGNSSRMGGDKALLPYQGRTLVEHVADQVFAAAGSVTLVGRPERYSDLGYPVIADERPGLGPLGGICTALRSTAAEWNLVTACDMPGISADFLKDLFGAASRAGADCLIPLSPSDKPEPLCAVYRRVVLPTLEKALSADRRKITDALAGLRTVFYPAPVAAWFDNLNTPADWANHRRDNPHV